MEIHSICCIAKHGNGFSSFNILEKVIHCMESGNLPYNSQEWDSPKGTAQEHVDRMKANQKEGFVLIFINLFFKLIMLFPLIILGNTILATI